MAIKYPERVKDHPFWQVLILEQYLANLPDVESPTFELVQIAGVPADEDVKEQLTEVYKQAIRAKRMELAFAIEAARRDWFALTMIIERN